MLVLLPVALAFIGALAILILQRVRPGYGDSWLIAVGISLMVWGLVLVLRWQENAVVSLQLWWPVDRTVFLTFQADRISWMYAFSLASLGMAVVLTAAVRLQYEITSWVWVETLLLQGAGLLVVLSGSFTTLIFVWTIIDIVELLVMLVNVRQASLRQAAVLSFMLRVTGTFMVIWATVRSQAFGTPLNLYNIIPEVGLLLLLAVGLRLGVVPLHLPYGEEPRLRRGLGTIVRLSAAASSLVVLARLPSQAIPAQWYPYLLAFAALAATYGAAMWATTKNELDGRPYLVIALAGLAFACVIQGNPIASIAWGVGLTLYGGLIFLFSIRLLPVYVIAVLGAVGLSGLPFTPSASGWAGLIGPHFSAASVFFILAHALILLGYLRHALRSSGTMEGLDRWVRFVYPAGLAGLVIVGWAIAVFGQAGGLTMGIWWASIPPAILAAGGWWLISRSGAQQEAAEGSGWFTVLAKPAGYWIGVVFSLSWLYRSLYFLYRLLQRLIKFFSLLLEGQGGVLWALLLLVLLSTLIASSGSL
ncbi:MAG: hypothetical protein K8R77_14080 [Anaerolineaceae bacterium]|nr:hypothetical protein [Anaerolineaceae bacterium]